MKKIYAIIAVLALLTLGYFAYSHFLISGNGENINEGFVYETDADSAQDCSAQEKYDETKHVCYFECDTDAQCTKIEKQIDDEFADWTDELKKDKEPVQEKVISESDPSLKASYTVSTGENIVLAKGRDDEKYRNIWQQIAALSPDVLSDKYIEEYQVFDNSKDDTLAFVSDDDGNGKWTVAVNLAGYNTSTAKENKITFVHELFHIISLNTSQVDPNITTCSNFKLDEGCAKTNSYINLFKSTFWKDTSKQDYQEGKFVTEYAATSEVEDLAESFAFFVLGKDKNSLGDTQAEQKEKFFYQFPDLVSLRQAMRNSLSKDIIGAKI